MLGVDGRYNEGMREFANYLLFDIYEPRHQHSMQVFCFWFNACTYMIFSCGKKTRYNKQEQSWENKVKFKIARPRPKLLTQDTDYDLQIARQNRHKQFLHAYETISILS